MKILIFNNDLSKSIELCNVTCYEVTNKAIIIYFKDISSREKGFKTFNNKFRRTIKFTDYLGHKRRKKLDYADGITYYNHIVLYFTLDSKLYRITRSKKIIFYD